MLQFASYTSRYIIVGTGGNVCAVFDDSLVQQKHLRYLLRHEADYNINATLVETFVVRRPATAWI